MKLLLSSTFLFFQEKQGYKRKRQGLNSLDNLEYALGNILNPFPTEKGK